MLCKTRAVK